MLSYTGKPKKVTTCDFCSSSNKVEWMCVACDKITCDRCKAIHQRSKRYGNHKILKIQGAVEIVISKDKEKDQETIESLQNEVELSIGKKVVPTEGKSRKAHSGRIIKGRRSLSIDEGDKKLKPSENLIPQVSNIKLDGRDGSSSSGSPVTVDDPLDNGILADMSHRERRRVAEFKDPFVDQEIWPGLNANGDSFKMQRDAHVSPEKASEIVQSPIKLLFGDNNQRDSNQTYQPANSTVNDQLPSNKFEQIPRKNLNGVTFSSQNSKGSSFLGVNRIPKDNEKNAREARPKVPRLKPTIISNFPTKLLWINAICPVNEYRCWFGDVTANSLFQIEEENDEISNTIVFDHKVTDIVLLLNGDLMISYEEGKKITRIDKEGNIISTLEMKPMCPQGMFVCKSGDLYVSLAGKIHAHRHPKTPVRIIKMTTEGEEKARLEFNAKGKKLFSYPHSVIENVNEDLCVVDMQGGGKVRLMVFDKKFDQRFVYDGKDKMSGAKPCDFGLVRNDSAGRLFLTDFVYHRIHVLSPDGHFIQFLMTVTDGIYFPFALAIDSSGYLWLDCKMTRNENSFSHILRIKYEST